MKKKIDWWRWVSDTAAAMATSCALADATRDVAPVGYPRRVWQWSVRAAGGDDLPCSSLGDGVLVAGSLVYLRQRGKHQWG
jgi:hypothetical protein